MKLRWNKVASREHSRWVSRENSRWVRIATLLFALPLMAFSAGGSRPLRSPVSEGAPQGIARGKKLILKDGSFQIVREWEVRPDPAGKADDRVRYYSLERSRYEELPASLVDFEATHKAEQAEAEHQAEMRKQIESTRIEQLAAEIDVDSSIEVAPGLFMPEGAGLFVLVPKPPPATSGNMLLPLTQAGAESKVDKGRLLTQILVPIPVIPGRHRIQLAGNKAVLRLDHLNPEFYIRTEDKREPEIELIRVKVKGDKREVEVVSTYITGDTQEKRNTISIQSWQVAHGVFRLTLAQPLAPGEYVFAEFLPSEGMNLYVWDFGLDPLEASPRKK